MLAFLHRLSALFFFLLGASFFLAYILVRNDLLATPAAWWLLAANVPLMLTAILYGGLSLYRSLTHPDHPSTVLAVFVALPLLGLFALLVALDFSPLWMR